MGPYVKHSKRTVRRGCRSCHSTDLYWAHDLARPVGISCAECGVSGQYVLIDRDGTPHACTASGLSAPPPSFAASSSESAAPDPYEAHETPTVPSKAPKPVGSYYPRYVEGATTDIQLLQKLRESGLHALLEGPPGTGKTALAMAAFPDAELVVCCADTEDADLEGSWVQTPSGTFDWYDGPIVKAAESGVPLIVDEVNLAPPSVLSHTLYPMMDGRGSFTVRGNPARGIVTAKPGFMVIGCANPNVPGGRFSEALLSRFTLQMRFETDWSLASSLGISREFVRVAKNLDVKRRANECEWTPQIRDAIAFKAVADAQSVEFAWRALIASSPEDDRPLVISVVSAVVGHAVESLSLGAAS